MVVRSVPSKGTKRAVCKGAGDDLTHQKRVASTPGPWCASCRRERRVATSARTHDGYVVKTYLSWTTDCYEA